MNALNLFVPCAAGVEAYLAAEVAQITGLPSSAMQTLRGGVQLQASWRDALLLNLHSRLGMRVLIQLAQAPYLNEQDIYKYSNRTYKIRIDGKHQFLDLHNPKYISKRYDQIQCISENRFGVQIDGFFGFINGTTFEEIVPIRADLITCFKDGIAP